MTLIQAHWVPALKNEFPDCRIRSSVVRPAQNAQQVFDYGLLGFDVIQIDRNLMRRQSELKAIARARGILAKQHQKEVAVSLLANEHCRGHCPFQAEHYVYNATRQEAEPKPYMFTRLKDVSCGLWRAQDPAFRLKVCDLPPFRKNWEEMLQYVQSFKMHGRDNVDFLKRSMSIVKNYAQGKEIVDEDKYQFFYDHNIEGERLAKWLQKTSNCRTQCWNCQFCDKLVKGTSSQSA